MHAPLVTAALIVRNEEEFLGDCLDSLAGFADEIIVVDTGSTDATVDIAAARGITVHSFPWTGDFSVARNQALDLANGEWILYIDADERVVHGAEVARRRLEKPSHLAFQVLLTPRPHSTPYWILRLWRNRRPIRFRGIIHESVWPALTEYQSEHGGKIGNIRLELDHRGYEANQSRKNERNLPMLQRAVLADPERVFSWCHMATIQWEMGNAETAEQSWRTAMDIVRRRAYLLQDDSLPWTGLLQFEMARQGDPSDLLEEALVRFPDDLQFSWIKGRFLMSRERFEEAIPYFERIARAGETGLFRRHMSYDVRLLGVLPQESLATCYFRLGGWGEAVRHYDLALQFEPDRIDLRAKRAVAANKSVSLAVKK